MAPRRRTQQRSTPTLQQVARVAGVSIATASRVITGVVPVSPERRARVEQAVELLGYVPDERARDLRRNVQKTVGYIIPTLADPLYGGVFRRLHRSLRDEGFTLLAYESHGEPASEQEAVGALVRSHARAVVVAAAPGLAPPAMQLLRRRDVRVVFFGDRPPETGATCVCVDDRRGSRVLTEHLLGLGHRRIGFISGTLEGSTGVDRHAGYLDALAGAGIASDPQLVGGFGWTPDFGRRAAGAMIGGADPPTAILAAHPMLAAGAFVSLRQAGRKVPSDISLASFFESDHIRFIDPPITCLTGIEEGTAAAIQTVLTSQPAPGGRIDVPLTPALRASTAPSAPAG